MHANEFEHFASEPPLIFAEPVAVVQMEPIYCMLKYLKFINQLFRVLKYL